MVIRMAETTLDQASDRFRLGLDPLLKAEVFNCPQHLVRERDKLTGHAITVDGHNSDIAVAERLDNGRLVISLLTV